MKLRFLNYGLGYLIAVLVAVTVAEAIMLFPTVLPDSGKFGSLAKNLRDLPSLFLFGFSFTFVLAFPGFALTLLAAHKLQSFSVNVFSVGGIATALLAHILLAVLGGREFFVPYIVFVCSIPGGMIGAYAYLRWRRWILSKFQVEETAA